MNLKNYICFYTLMLALATTTNLLGEGFVAGALICTPQGYVAIEDLSVNDHIITCDFDSGYKAVPIVAVTRQEVDDFVRVKIGDATIDVASDQTFFAPYTHEWIQASHLAEGICLLGAPLKADYIESVATIDQKTYVYNLSLAEHHNYLVGQRHVMVHNFGEFGCATFGVLEAAQGTTVLNAFLLAHPLVAPVVICAGGATLIGYVAWSFWNIFKQPRNALKKDNTTNSRRRSSAAHQAKKSKHNKPCIHHKSHKHACIQSQCAAAIESIQQSIITVNKESSVQFIAQAQELYDRTINSGTTDAEIRVTCGTGQLNDATLPVSSCLPGLHNNSECLYPEQANGIEQEGGCDAGLYEPVIEPRPCGYQGQTLPGLESDAIPMGENEDASAGEGEEVESGEDEDPQAEVSGEYDEIEIEHGSSDDMVVSEKFEASVNCVEDKGISFDHINKEPSSEADTKFNPLIKIKYTDKVFRQMLSGDYHSFPLSVDSFGSEGQVKEIVGGDGVARIKVTIDGGFMKKDGVFEYIIERDGITCNHRLFKSKLME